MFEEVAGRTTAIVPSIQLLRSPLVVLGGPSTAPAKNKNKVSVTDSTPTAAGLASVAATSAVAGEIVNRKRKASEVEVKKEIKVEVKVKVKVEAAGESVRGKSKQKVKKEVGATPTARKSPRLA